MARKKKVVEKTPRVTSEQIRVIERHDSLIRELTLEFKNKELSKNNLVLNYELAMSKYNTESQLLKKSINDKIESHKHFMKEIACELGIEGRWSFNPDTGDIIKED